MALKSIHEIVSIWKQQKRNWRIVVTRRVFNRFFNQLTLEYTNIYVSQLGASPVQLGSVNSLAGLVSTLLAIPIGLMHDKYSLRKLFVFGCGLVAISSLLYALAPNWMMIIPAIILARLAMRFHCSIICDVSLKSESRATAKALCEGTGSTPSLIAPMVAAFLITLFGGISAEGIRPLYGLQFIAYSILFFFILTQLKEVARGSQQETSGKERSDFLGGVFEVLRNNSAAKKFIIFYALSMFTMSMTNPFWYLFANEVKGANQLIIGAMATVGIFVKILLAPSIGRVADRIGRKKVFYILLPIVGLANIILVFTPTPELLLASSLLRGFTAVISIVIIGSMTPELVSYRYLGRWRGLLGFFGGISSILAPIVGGMIWETIGPAYVFLIALGVDLCVRLPIMTTIPETLKTMESTPQSSI
jgi:MFS family permease